MLREAFERTDIQKAINAAGANSSNVSEISLVSPKIVTQEYAEAAFELVTAPSANRDEWLPEALSLFNTKGLNSSQLRCMVSSVLSPIFELTKEDLKSLADVCSRIGRLGFSFPQWRFVCLGIGGKSLIENFGMERLQRETDIRDAELPPYDPNRDKYGVGFVFEESDWYIEYRRAYIVCSHSSEENSATVIIRNNSYFYGRDRLPAPFYVSWEPISAEVLKDLDDSSLSKGGVFVRLQDMLRSSSELSVSEKSRRLCNLLDFIDDFDSKLSLWLRAGMPIKSTSRFDVINNSVGQGAGLDHLRDFLSKALSQHRERGKETAPFYITEINKDMPPWLTRNAFALDEAFLDGLTQYKDGQSLNNHELDRLLSADKSSDTKLILLTGPDGDFPLKPKNENGLLKLSK